MNLTWHIVKKDLRSLKWPLLLWTLLIVGKLGVGVLLLRTKGADTEEINSLMHLQAAVYILTGLECISFVLAAALIQEDLLVGTTAFWVTRPISGARLLRAKLLGLVLIFGLLPLLVMLPWWLWNGYGPTEICWAALETILIQTACVLVGLLWSVVTDGFARFLMWTLAMLVAVPLTTASVAYYVTSHPPEPQPGVMVTRFGLVLGLAVIGILALTVHQFLTRKLWRSVAIIGATVGLIVATALWWPWNLDPGERWNQYLLRRAVQNTRQVAEPAGLSYVLDSVQVTPPSANHPERPTQVRVRFAVKGLPDDLTLWPWSAKYELRWSDGLTDTRSTWLSWNSRKKLASRALLGDPVKTDDEPEQFTVTLFLKPDLADRFLREPPAFTLDASMWVMRSDSVTKVPSQPGLRVMDGSATERIAQVETDSGKLVVTTVRTRPEFWLNAYASHLEGVRSTFSQSVLLNRERREVGYGHREWALETRVASVSVGIDKLLYTGPIPLNTAKPSAADRIRQAEWVQHAELLRENLTRQGWFTHKLEVSALRADDAKP
jgi:hypothetical protein